MRPRRKDALKILAVSVPMLAYGAFTFEIGGAASTAEAIAKSTVTGLGLFGTVAGFLMFFTKNSLGLVNPKEPAYSLEEEPSDSWREDTVWEKEKPVQEEEPKPIIKKEKEMSKIKDAITKEKPVKKSGSESIGLMQREKELVKRADELTTLVNEVETELNQVRENLETKGWVNSDNGWVIE